jgi:hypothetical protein
VGARAGLDVLEKTVFFTKDTLVIYEQQKESRDSKEDPLVQIVRM